MDFRLRFGLLLLLAVMSTASMPVRADQADDRYAVAAGHYAQARWDLAAEAFHEFLDAHADDDRADQSVFYLAGALLQSGHHDEAQRQFAEYLRRAPDGPHARAARFRQGEAAYLDHRFPEAKTTLEAFQCDHPGDELDAYVLAYLGEIALADQRAADAEHHFREALDRFPAGAMADDCRLGLARALAAQDNDDEAAHYLAALAAKHGSPLSADARYRLGVLHYHAGRLAEAVETLAPLDKSSAINGQVASDGAILRRARLTRALALRKLDRDDQALALLETLVADTELGPAARLHVGIIQKNRGQHAEAAETLQQAAEAEPHHDLAPAIHFHAGDALLRAGRTADALAQFQRAAAAAKGPLRSDALLAEAGALVTLKRFAEAIEPLEQFLETQPPDATRVKAMAQLAVCLARGGRLDRAKALHRELLAKYADHDVFTSTVAQLAEAAYAADDWPWAGELFAWLADASAAPQYAARGLSGLAWCQFHRGQTKQAEATLDRLLGLDADARLVAEAAWLRGRILQNNGQADAALAMYALVLDGRVEPSSRCFREALLAAARLRDELNQPEQSAELYARLLDACPDHPERAAAMIEWSWVLDVLDRRDEATAALKRLTKEFPESQHALEAAARLAQRAFDARDFAEATQWIDAVLKGDPRRSTAAHAMRLRWQIAAMEKRWDDVRRAAEQLKNDDPESPLRLMADFWIAEAAYRQADYTTAGDLFEKLLAQTSDHGETWMAMIPLRRAQVAAQQGDWLDAMDIASRIAADYPGFQQQYEVDYLLGRCLATRADFRGAREAYTRVIRSEHGAKTETAAMAQWMIGETYLHQKDYEAALGEFLKVEILYAYPTWQAAALVEAAKCYEQLGRRDEAVVIYRRVADEFADTPAARHFTQGLNPPHATPDARQAQRPNAPSTVPQ